MERGSRREWPTSVGESFEARSAKRIESGPELKDVGAEETPVQTAGQRLFAELEEIGFEVQEFLDGGVAHVYTANQEELWKVAAKHKVTLIYVGEYVENPNIKIWKFSLV